MAINTDVNLDKHHLRVDSKIDNSKGKLQMRTHTNYREEISISTSPNAVAENKHMLKHSFGSFCCSKQDVQYNRN